MEFNQEFFELLKNDPCEALRNVGVENPTDEMLKDIKNFVDNGVFAGESLLGKLNEQNINVGD